MSGSLTAEDKGALKTALNALKSRELHCAVGAGGKIADIRLHQSAGGGTLRRELQKDKDLTKFAFGTATRAQDDQTNLFLSLDKDMPSGFCKRLARQLRFGGVRIVTIMVDGKIVQSGRDEENEAVDGAPGPSQAQVAPSAAPVPLTPDIIERIMVAAKRINTIPALDSRGAAARTLLTHMKEAMQQTRGAPPLAQLEQLEQLVAAPVPEYDAFFSGVRAARPELIAAQNEATGIDKEQLLHFVGEMKAAADDTRFSEAAVLCRQARSIAIQVLAGAEQQAQGEKLMRLVSPTLTVIKESTFTKESVQALTKLHPGRHFKALIEAEAKCASKPSTEACDAVTAVAGAYLKHFAKLKPQQQDGEEPQAKKRAAEGALVGARRLKLALAFDKLGPAPWNKAQQTKAAELRAAFMFENMNVADLHNGTAQPGLMAKPFTGGETPAFMVEGRPLNGRPSDPERLMVFKPVDGEKELDGFPSGGNAPREALTHALAETVGAMTGLRLGCPETNLVSVASRSVDVATFNESVPHEADEEDEKKRFQLDTNKDEFVGSIQQYARSAGSLADNLDKVDLNSISADDCHRTAIIDILSLNLDRHYGNLLVEKQANGAHGIVPIDHGMAFPSMDSVRQRLPRRMNTPELNALLLLPGSYQPMSREMQERLEMLDPARLRVALGQSKAVLAERFPGLGVDDKVPNETLDIAARSARFLKLAASSLSPAVIQLAIAAEYETLFTVAEAQFEAEAQRIIGDYQGRSAVLSAIYIRRDPTLLAMHERLQALRWLPSGGFAARKAEFRQWLARNPQRALDLYNANTPAPDARAPSYA